MHLWTRFSVRFACVVLVSTCGSVAAVAKSPVSSNFDGRYHANPQPIAGMSGPDCQPFMVAPITITKGLLTGAPSAGAAVQGIVTQDGFLTGALLRPGQERLTFEGRFVDGLFSGAVLDRAAGCAWTITLSPIP